MAHNLAGYIRKFNGFTQEAILVDSHAFGDSWKEALYTGIRGAKDITVGGYYEDVAASGPHALLGQTTCLGSERNLELDFGSSDIAAFDVLIMDYTRSPVVEDLTEWECTMRVTGAVATAT